MIVACLLARLPAHAETQLVAFTNAELLPVSGPPISPGTIDLPPLNVASFQKENLWWRKPREGKMSTSVSSLTRCPPTS
jgi:hypothetical protein